MIYHLVYCYGKCVGIARHDIGGRVANEYAVHATGINYRRSCEIIGCKHGHFLSTLLERIEGLYSDFLVVST